MTNINGQIVSFGEIKIAELKQSETKRQLGCSINNKLEMYFNGINSFLNDTE